jgi:hypothetical protein
MNISSLGLRTDLMLLRFDGEIYDRGDYYVVRTPSNPRFYFGNFLLFKQSPALGNFKNWTDLFKQEFADLPEVKHFTFCWDDPTGAKGQMDSFMKKGFTLFENSVLSTKSVRKNLKFNSDAEIRKIQTESEWEQVIESQIECRDLKYEEKSYERFTRDQFKRFRRMVALGLGSWFGAFIGEEVAANLGIFVDNGLGRFQNVTTRFEFRRQGLCGTLVYEASRYAMDDLKAKNLVMIADSHYYAAKIYESVGFKPTEKLSYLLRFPRTF